MKKAPPRTATILTHVPFEGPAILSDELRRHGLTPRTCLVPEDGLPEQAGDFLLVMGGPMSVNDPKLWIERERQFIRKAVEEGTPFLGICFGAQMLASAFGGRVGPGPRFEAGLTRVRFNAGLLEDARFSGWPDTLDVFEWHGEGIEPPDQAVVLASSEDFPVQAFRIGARAYGFLFHLEMNEEGVRRLCRHCPGNLEQAGRTADEVLEEALPRLNHLQSRARTFLNALLTT